MGKVAKIVAIVNQKGGVGKTTTCVNLAAALKYLGKRVLLCDFDPQANATSGMGVDKSTSNGVYDVLINGVDTAKGSTMDITPFKNLLNDMYAQDISKKISLSYQMRREKGIPTSWCTPYGYQLNQQGNKFEATEDAKWVKLIYQWYLAGVSTNEIARRLEFLEVARPNERLNRKLHEGDDPTYNKWHPSTVLRILNSSAYIGELVSGKTQTASYKGCLLYTSDAADD